MFLRGAARRGAGAYRPPPTAAVAAAASPPSLRDESTLGSKTTNPTGDHVTDKILALNCSLHRAVGRSENPGGLVVLWWA